MIPVGLNSDGVMTYRMTGSFAEVFDNLQVCMLQNKTLMHSFPAMLSAMKKFVSFLSIQS
jgi:hypothetical protein